MKVIIIKSWEEEAIRIDEGYAAISISSHILKMMQANQKYLRENCRDLSSLSNVARFIQIRLRNTKLQSFY